MALILVAYRVEGAGPYVVKTNFLIVKGKLTIGTVARPYDGKIQFILTNGGYEYKFNGATMGIKAFAIVCPPSISSVCELVKNKYSVYLAIN